MVRKGVVVVVPIPELMLNAAKVYFYEQASAEVIHFVDPSRYMNFFAE